ncbi:MAG: VUT family protein [Spirochaetaceae bacterium]|nr:MAG: VUT family protein [Spirochaetaceae bacterium]
MGNELLWLLVLAINFALILVVYRSFGRDGLYAWTVLCVITANIQVVKTVELFGMTATLGNIVYAGSFLITDILSENYGARAARRAVFFGFIGIVGFTVLMNLALLFEPAADDFAHASMQTIFGFLPRIALASLTAYLVSQLHDVWAYAFWRRLFPGRRAIWIRNNLSTLVSQLFDSLVFTLAAFAGVFPGRVLLEIVITTYLLKAIVAVADTPLVYVAGRWHRRRRVRDQED